MNDHTKIAEKNILITGASGMIGVALASHLERAGYTVYSLKRHSADAPFRYDETSKTVFLDKDISLYAVINLAGPSLADKRWSDARKRVLLSSRVDLTSALSRALAVLPSKPKLLLSASAIGYYGLTGSKTVTESSPAGDDFLAQIGQEWESATQPAEQAGINTVHLRLGVVLSKRGGMLQRQLIPFRLGLGGRLGTGKQFLSWISLTDVLQTILFLLENNPEAGPINVVATEPVTNEDFTAQLTRLLRRPGLLPLPAFLIKLLFGEMGEVLLLGSSRVQSEKLAALGIELQHPTLHSALSAELGTDHV